MPKLTSDEARAFLNEPGILMRIGVVEASGAPLVTPIWFLHDSGEILFTPREKSVWFAALRREPRISLCIDEDALPYRKVLIAGVARLVHDVGNDDVWRHQYHAMATKYVGERGATKYLEDTIDQPRGLYSVSLSEAKVTSWRMPVAGEPGMGIWANRYYTPGTEF